MADDPLCKKLLHAIRYSDISHLTEAIKDFKEQSLDLNFEFDKHGNFQTPLVLAVEYGNLDCVSKLVDAGADVNRMASLHKLAPIHLAAKSGRFEILKFLVDNNADVNLHDKRGFTPIHCCVEEKWTEQNKENYSKCLKYLLDLPDDRVKLNERNMKTFTAVHMAAQKSSKEAVILFLEMGSKLDIDTNLRENQDSTRDIIARKYPDLELPKKQETHNIKMDASMLFSLLYSNNEDRFCEAFEKEMEDKFQKSLLTTTDGTYTLLQLCCKEGYEKAVSLLLEKGADVNYYTDKTPQTPLSVACLRPNPKIFETLLEKAPDFLPCYGSLDGCTVLHYLSKIKGDNAKECLEKVLKHNGAVQLINWQDSVGNTALHYAIMFSNEEAALLLLNRGAYIGIFNKFQDTSLFHMSSSTLEKHLDNSIAREGESHEEFHRYILNLSFLNPPKRVKEKQKAESIKLVEEGNIPSEKHNYSFNQHCRTYIETEPLLLMSRSKELRHLLKHPIFSSFIYLKWQRVQMIYIINLLLYFLFCLLLTTYILSGGPSRETAQPTIQPVFHNSIEPPDINRSLHDKETINEEASPTNIAHSSSPDFRPFITLLLSIFVAIFIVRETFQIIVSFTRYWKHFENYIELAVLITTSTIIVRDCSLGPQDSYKVLVCSQLSAIGILLAWISFVLLLGKHPRLCINIEMFKTVSVNFLQFLAWYALLIIAFALSFFTLFRGCHDKECEEQPFLNPASSVFKTIVMMTGEFESGDIPFVSVVGTSHVIFVLFVFLIAIVLLNLLNGLAVSDTQAIRNDVILHSHISQVNMIYDVESILQGDPIPFRGFLQRIHKNWNSFPNFSEDQMFGLDYFARRITLFSGLLPYNKLWVYPNRSNRLTFTPDHEGMCRPQRKCFDLSYFLHSSSVQDLKNILNKKSTENNQISELLHIRQELSDCQTKLSSVQDMLRSLHKEHKQNEQFLIKILSLISLKNNESD